MWNEADLWRKPERETGEKRNRANRESGGARGPRKAQQKFAERRKVYLRG